MNAEKTVVILAAGMGKRYGGIKQIQPLGPSGETILDYAIYDAVRSGFSKLVFITRKEIESEIINTFHTKWESQIHIEMVYQDVKHHCPHHIASKRQKPWGTAQALLCAADKTTSPFVVINADDFYGREAFNKAANFLDNRCNEITYGLVTYQLQQTLSKHGTVNRGVCSVANNEVQHIKEIINISQQGNHICYTDGDGNTNILDKETPVSMNYLCFSPSIFPYAEKGFEEFLKNADALEKEFFIPLLLNNLLQSAQHPITINAIPTSSKWFGVTYQEDNTTVTAELEKMHKTNVYPTPIEGKR